MSDLTYTLPVGKCGLWTGEEQPEHVTGRLVFRMQSYTEPDGTLDRWVHARFYFDSKLWDVDKHGLIYTDETFIDALHARLRAYGWQHPERCIHYSESGMQGDNYVDFDVMGDENTLFNLLATNTNVHDKWPETANKQLAA
jgi:hypothetical protein